MSDRKRLGWAIATDPEVEVIWPSALAYIMSGVHYAQTDGADPDLFEQWTRDTEAWLDALTRGDDPTTYEETLGIVAVYEKEETNANDDQQ